MKKLSEKKSKIYSFDLNKSNSKDKKIKAEQKVQFIFTNFYSKLRFRFSKKLVFIFKTARKFTLNSSANYFIAF
mgnify:CR=1 FL=1